MTYKKLETKLKHDTARNEHIKDIERLEKQLTFTRFNTDAYTRINEKINLYKRQLKLYDETIYKGE